MKRLISVVLCMSLIVIASGCSSGEIDGSETSAEETTPAVVTDESTTSEASAESKATETSETTAEETTSEETTTAETTVEPEESEETDVSNETEESTVPDTSVESEEAVDESEVTESAETTTEETETSETVPVETLPAETEPAAETTAPTETSISVETVVEVEETAVSQQPQTDDGRIPYVEGQEPPTAPEGMEYKLVVSVYGDEAWYELRPLPTPVPTHTMEEWMQIQGINSYVNSDGVTVYGYYVDTTVLNEATNEYRVSIGLPELEVVSGDTYLLYYDSSAKQACIDSYDLTSPNWHKCSNLTTYDPEYAFNAFYESEGHRIAMEKDWATQTASASFMFYIYVDDATGFQYEFTKTAQSIC